MRITQDFSYTSFGRTSTSRAYTDDGKVWRWCSNDQVCPLDAAREYGIPVDPQAQEQARKVELDKFLSEYRKLMRNHVPSAEEQYEMKAAFGEGVEVVNVITKQRYRT